jgi:ATP-binding cassette subfamily F protein 3
MLLHPANLLILDEPTNHLDIKSKDVLLSALKNWKGTVVFVSHDRDFMEALSTKVLELSVDADGVHHAQLYYGGYGYYVERKENSTTDYTDYTDVNNTAGKTNTAPTDKLSREEKKRLEAEERRRRRAVEAAMQNIEELEAEKDRLEAELARPEVYSNGSKAAEVSKQLESVRADLEKANSEWENLQ